MNGLTLVRLLRIQAGIEALEDEYAEAGTWSRILHHRAADAVLALIDNLDGDITSSPR